MIKFITLLITFTVFSTVISDAEGKDTGVVVSAGDTSTLSIYFRLSSAVVDTSYMQNGAVLDTVLARLERGGCHEISLVMGAASFDGKKVYNASLSQKRVDSVIRYLKKRIPGLDESCFNIEYRAEDWEGLKVRVSDDPDVPQKSIAELLIDEDYDEDIKEMVIKIFPDIYRYLLDNHLPFTRAVTFKFLNQRMFDGVAAVAPVEGKVIRGGGK